MSEVRARGRLFDVVPVPIGAQPASTLNEHRLTVAPLPSEEILRPCEYRFAPPPRKDEVKDAWVVFERGQDSIKWFEDEEIRRFAAEHNLALMPAMQCGSKEREDMIVDPNKGVGRTLFAALDQFAQTENMPALKTARVVVLGWSGAGSLAGRLAAFRPERYLAGVDYLPGQYEPLGVDTIDLKPEAFRAPQLIVANGADHVNGTERPYNYFRKYFDKGARWTFAVQNRAPHCCLQNVKALILTWLDGVLNMRQGPEIYGYIRTEFSEVRDEWYTSVFDVTAARTGTGRLPSGKAELPAGWIPSPGFAKAWLELERRHEPAAIWNP